MTNEVLKYEVENAQGSHRVKFFSRPHPLGGVTYAFDWMFNGKSQGLVEARDKDTVVADFWHLKTMLECECQVNGLYANCKKCL